MIEFAPFFEKEMIYKVDIPYSRCDESIGDLVESTTGRIYVIFNYFTRGATIHFTDANAAVMFRLAMN